VFDAWGDIDEDGAGLFEQAFAFAAIAGDDDDASGTSATGARAFDGHREEALLEADFATAAASGAGIGGGAGGGAGAAAIGADVDAFVGDFFFAAEGGFVKINSNFLFQVTCIAGFAEAEGAEQISEDAVDSDAAEVGEVEGHTAEGVSAAEGVTWARGGVSAGLAEAIEHCSFFGIAKDLVGGVDFFEAFVSLGVIGVAVGVMFSRKLAKRRLDFIRGSVA
jgi:hypothetical protein